MRKRGGRRGREEGGEGERREGRKRGGRGGREEGGEEERREGRERGGRGGREEGGEEERREGRKRGGREGREEDGRRLCPGKGKNGRKSIGRRNGKKRREKKKIRRREEERKGIKRVSQAVSEVLYECGYLLGILPRGSSCCVSWIRTFWKSTNRDALTYHEATTVVTVSRLSARVGGRRRGEGGGWKRR